MGTPTQYPKLSKNNKRSIRDSENWFAVLSLEDNEDMESSNKIDDKIVKHHDSLSKVDKEKINKTITEEKSNQENVCSVKNEVQANKKYSKLDNEKINKT